MESLPSLVLQQVADYGDNLVDADQTQLAADFLHRDVALREGDHLVKECVGITHGAGRLFCNPEEGILIGLYFHLGCCFQKAVLDEVDVDKLEMELLAA